MYIFLLFKKLKTFQANLFSYLPQCFSLSKSILLQCFSLFPPLFCNLNLLILFSVLFIYFTPLFNFDWYVLLMSLLFIFAIYFFRLYKSLFKSLQSMYLFFYAFISFLLTLSNKVEKCLWLCFFCASALYYSWIFFESLKIVDDIYAVWPIDLET